MEDNGKSNSRVGRTISVFLICFVLVLGRFFSDQSLRVVNPKSLCSRVEVDANEIAVAISGYLSGSGHNIDTLTKEEIEARVSIRSPWTLTKCGDDIYIHVIDRTGKCPANYQKPYPEWHSNLYTVKF